jgi:hypothetical protein
MAQEYGKSSGETTEKRDSSAVVDDYARGNLPPFEHPLDLVFGNGFAGRPVRGGHMRDRRRWAARKAENTNHICYSTRNAIEKSILTALRAGI